MTDWSAHLQRGTYADAARALIASDKRLDRGTLRWNPRGGIEAIDGLTIVETGTLPSGCGGGGYYDHANRTIYFAPSGNKRDNFTLLHELGHAVQAENWDWQLAVLDLHRDQQRSVAESVADAIAAELLLGDPQPGDTNSPTHLSPAAVMAHLESRSRASRSAVVHHVSATLQGSQRWILAVADVSGSVQFACATFDATPPARGLVQPGFAALAAEAAGRDLVRRRFTEGLRYKTGRQLDDLHAHASLDSSAAYVFVALTPIYEFSAPKVVDTQEECANPTCHVDYYAAREIYPCARCGVARCPMCQTCHCEAPRVATICDRCFLTISPYEASTGSHQC